MLKLSKIGLLGMAGLLLAALPASAKPKPASVQTAVIENTGSTNTLGYKITVISTGSLIRITAADSSSNGNDLKLGNMVASNESPLKDQAHKFFADLNAAMPLSSLPVRHGMRSASFGTQTYITYKGQRSPDLTFVSDPRTAALKADIDSITRALHVGNAPRRPIVIHADR
jgi:hypothetical protein